MEVKQTFLEMVEEAYADLKVIDIDYFPTAITSADEVEEESLKESNGTLKN